MSLNEVLSETWLQIQDTIIERKDDHHLVEAVEADLAYVVQLLDDYGADTDALVWSRFPHGVYDQATGLYQHLLTSVVNITHAMSHAPRVLDALQPLLVLLASTCDLSLTHFRWRDSYPGGTKVPDDYEARQVKAERFSTSVKRIQDGQAIAALLFDNPTFTVSLTLYHYDFAAASPRQGGSLVAGFDSPP